MKAWKIKGGMIIIAVILLILVSSGCIKQSYSTEVNDIFENLKYPQRCKTSNDCDIQHSCLKCPDEKMVISQGCQKEPKVLIGLEDEGICVQTHMLGSSYDEFKTGECIPNTAFCLVNIDSKEVPTVNTEMKKWVPLWKEFVLNSQKISESYFNDHISIESFDTSEWREGTSFRINYNINIDWASVKSCDHFLIKRKNETDYLTKEEIYSISSFMGGLKDRVFLSNGCGNSAKLKEFDKIISQSEVTPKIKECHSSIEWSPKERVILNNKGNLVAYAYGTINFDQNKCKRASLDLETGALLECRDTSCWIT